MIGRCRNAGQASRGVDVKYTMTKPVQVAALAAALAFAWTTVGQSQAQAPAPGGAQRRGAQGRGANAGPPIDAAAAARGRQLFATNCTVCHGPTGRGGAVGATDLSISNIAQAADDGAALIAFLKTGRPERRMPSFSFPDSDVRDLHTYFRTIAPAGGRGRERGRGGPVAEVVGDAAAGEAYFNGAGGCTACHSATGDLKGIGARLSPTAIQGKVVYPRGDGGYPPSFKSPPNPDEAPVMVTVTPAAGAAITGTLMWITDFNVTLVDEAGVERTIARNGDAPKVVVKDPIQAHIDRLPMLTDKVMHDLTAYLVTLK